MKNIFLMTQNESVIELKADYSDCEKVKFMESVENYRICILIFAISTLNSTSSANVIIFKNN